MKYAAHKKIPLRSTPELSEKWVQERIIDDPRILGLGELDVKDVERIQPHAGRLDLLLADAESTTRYEVEIQLGATDESHIIRTLEYWDMERRRYPQYDHVAVIVAEEITSRFFNVIGLFNGYIPIVAIQMSAIAFDDEHVTLIFTKVLDHQVLGTEEEDEGEPTDRKYWESKSTPAMLALSDQILTKFVKEIDPSVEFKYNRAYIGLARNGLATNFVSIRPRKKHVIMEVKLPRSEEISALIENAGMDSLTYSNRWGRYRMSVSAKDVEEQSELLLGLVKRAHDTYYS
jgi:predicted transport protein